MAGDRASAVHRRADPLAQGLQDQPAEGVGHRPYRREPARSYSDAAGGGAAGGVSPRSTAVLCQRRGGHPAGSAARRSPPAAQAGGGCLQWPLQCALRPARLPHLRGSGLSHQIPGLLPVPPAAGGRAEAAGGQFYRGTEGDLVAVRGDVGPLRRAGGTGDQQAAGTRLGSGQPSDGDRD
ncbi:hypothetical protein AO056_04104 [Aeromonas hydrophila]|nr:hypothetical protein AO056_04104 [Aeromonas hydrophila]